MSQPEFSMARALAVRRDGKRHTERDLHALAKAAADGSVPDYQLAAWLMAAYLNPLDEDQTAWLTQGMAESGERLHLDGLPKPWVDKHSTGGVGDKTTLVLLPLLAACGLTMVKMSGRGLGITGGTVDKLASIPGFRLDLSPEEMVAQAKRIGLALTGQTPNLAPADKALYALRDSIGAVSSIPLIVSSILSKKIAGGADTIVLDVKCGSGAFMRTTQEARVLARWLKEIGDRCGLRVRAAITDMHQPLGSAIGNALEVREAVEVLRGDAPMSAPTLRFRELCLDLAGHTLEAVEFAKDRKEGRARAEEILVSGQAKEKARAWFLAQGATVDLFENPGALSEAPARSTLGAESTGWVSSIDAERFGQAVVDLGGGRKTKDDAIDPSVGIVLHSCVGQPIAKGAPLFSVHAKSAEDAEEIQKRLAKSVGIAPFERPIPKVILAVI